MSFPASLLFAGLIRRQLRFGLQHFGPQIGVLIA